MSQQKIDHFKRQFIIPVIISGYHFRLFEFTKEIQSQIILINQNSLFDKIILSVKIKMNKLRKIYQPFNQIKNIN